MGQIVNQQLMANLAVEFNVGAHADRTVMASCGLHHHPNQRQNHRRQTIVVPVEGGKPKRMLMAFTRHGATHTPGTLCIHDQQRNYTPEYVQLVKEFYLKM